MLPIPESRLWSSSGRLTSDARRRTRATKSRRRTRGRAGRARCARSPGGSSAPRRETSRPPNMRWSTKRSSTLGASSKTSRTRRCGSSGASGGWTRNWPLMPRWPSRASPSSRGSQRYLPRRRAASILRPVNPAAKPAGPRGSRRTGRGAAPRPRRWCGRRRGARGRADHLDLGQLGHRVRCSASASAAALAAGSGTSRAGAMLAVRRLGRPARPPSWTGRCRCRRARRRRAPGR